MYIQGSSDQEINRVPLTPLKVRPYGRVKNELFQGESHFSRFGCILIFSPEKVKYRKALFAKLLFSCIVQNWLSNPILALFQRGSTTATGVHTPPTDPPSIFTLQYMGYFSFELIAEAC